MSLALSGERKESLRGLAVLDTGQGCLTVYGAGHVSLALNGAGNVSLSARGKLATEHVSLALIGF